MFGKKPKDIHKKLILSKKKQLKKLVKEKKYSQVLKLGREILEKAPDDLDVLFVVGGLFYMQKKFTKANECFDKILNISTYDVDVLLLKANSLFQLKRFDESILCCNKIREVDPKNKDVLQLLSNIDNSDTESTM